MKTHFYNEPGSDMPSIAANACLEVYGSLAAITEGIVVASSKTSF